MITSRDLFERFESAVAPGTRILREVGGVSLERPDLLERIRRTARDLRAEGAGPGDLVLTRGLRGTSLVVGLLAIWSVDAAALAAEASTPAAELEGIAGDFKARHSLFHGAGGALRATAIPGAPRGTLREGTAIVKLTSGSLGKARGIEVGAAHLLSDGRQVVQGMGLRATDVQVAAISMAHSYGLGSLILPMVLLGCPLLVVEEPLPGPLREALSGDEPRVFPGVPALFDMLCALPEGRSAFPALRLCISAGAPLRPATAAAFRSRYGLPVRAFYGTSESGGITFDASADGLAAEREEGCVGTPLPGVEVCLAGDERRVSARSGAVAHGYLEGDLAGRGDGEFRDGWFLSGDTGGIDSAGRLTLTGRIGALVNVAGRKVNPREVETLLLAVPGVGDAVVLGMPDEARGEALVACLVARPEVTRETVMSRLRKDLTGYKLPRRFIFLESIPRTDRGKVDRPALLRFARSAHSPEFRR